MADPEQDPDLLAIARAQDCELAIDRQFERFGQPVLKVAIPVRVERGGEVKVLAHRHPLDKAAGCTKPRRPSSGLSNRAVGVPELRQVPVLGNVSPAARWISVVLPAPFRLRSPTTWPAGISRPEGIKGEVPGIGMGCRFP